MEVPIGITFIECQDHNKNTEYMRMNGEQKIERKIQIYASL